MWKSCPVQLALKVSWEQKQCKLWRASYSNPAAPTRHIPCARQQKVVEILRERAPATKETLRSESEHLRTKPAVWLRIAKRLHCINHFFFCLLRASGRMQNVDTYWLVGGLIRISPGGNGNKINTRNHQRNHQRNELNSCWMAWNYSLSHRSLPCLRQIAGPELWESSHRLVFNHGSYSPILASVEDFQPFGSYPKIWTTREMYLNVSTWLNFRKMMVNQIMINDKNHWVLRCFHRFSTQKPPWDSNPQIWATRSTAWVISGS